MNGVGEVIIASRPTWRQAMNLAAKWAHQGAYRYAVRRTRSGRWGIYRGARR